jgi:hypothetical protein
MDGSCSDDSEIEEERAGGGPGPTGEGQEQEDRRGRIRADNVYPESWRNAGGAFTNRMTAETLGVRADIACVNQCDLYMHRPPEVVLTLFRSIRFQSYAVESQTQTANKRIGNVSCRIQL